MKPKIYLLVLIGQIFVLLAQVNILSRVDFSFREEPYSWSLLIVSFGLIVFTIFNFLKLKKKLTFTLYNKDNFITSNWSGGSTRQLYIFPPNSTYANRDFSIRISSAKVEVKESVFTPLPGVSRKLMVLEGNLNINHENHHSIDLAPFEIDSFLGDWKTTSVGICTDFNVMTQGNLKSELTSVVLPSNRKQELKINRSWSSVFIYLHSGNIEITVFGKKAMLSSGELLVMEYWKYDSIKFLATSDSQIVLTKIK